MVLRRNRPLRVLHLPVNIRWIMDATIKAEEEMGIETKKMLISRAGVDESKQERIDYLPYFSGSRKLSLSYVKYLMYVASFFWNYARLLRWADVVHWQYSNRLWIGSGALKNFDFFLLRLFNKPAIVQFHGGDLRDNEYWLKIVPWWSEAYEKEKFEYLQMRAKETQEKFADADFCFALGYGMYPFVWEENKSRTIIMERSIELRPSKLQAGPESNKVKIVHAPSNPSVKGTKYVLKAIENLKVDFDFEFVLIQDVGHEVVLDALEGADIVIDQLVTGEYGLFAVEGMNARAAVISNVNEILRELYPSDLPIVQAEPATIEDVLRTLLENPEMRKHYAELGPAYANRLHECHSALENVLKAYLFAANRKGKKNTAKKIEYYLEKFHKES